MKLFKRKPSIEKAQLDLDCDLILHQIGGTGLWQALNFILLCLPTMASGFLVLSFVFTGKYFQLKYQKVLFAQIIHKHDVMSKSFTTQNVVF